MFPSHRFERISFFPGHFSKLPCRSQLFACLYRRLPGLGLFQIITGALFVDARSSRSLLLQEQSLPERARKTHGAPGEGLRDSSRRETFPEPLRDILSRRKTKSPRSRREDRQGKNTPGSRHKTIGWQTNHMDQVPSIPGPTRQRLPSPGIRGRLRLRNLRKGSDPPTSINSLRRRRINSRTAREALCKGEQGR